MLGAALNKKLSLRGGRWKAMVGAAWDKKLSMERRDTKIYAWSGVW